MPKKKKKEAAVFAELLYLSAKLYGFLPILIPCINIKSHMVKAKMTP
jgi:hypothetical protein